MASIRPSRVAASNDRSLPFAMFSQHLDQCPLRADPCRSRSAAGGPLSRPLPPFQATPRSPSPMAMAKNVERDLAPDSPAELMHHGPHQAGALLRRKDRDRTDGQACEDNYSHNDAPCD